LDNLQSIPRRAYIAWPDATLLTSNLTVAKRGVQALIAHNPTWTFHLYDDEQINDFLRVHLDIDDFQRVEREHIVERNDLWRLLVMYYHGGYYQDVDRPSAPNLDELLASVRMCLPISGTRRNYGNFQQDVMCTGRCNPALKHAIELNLWRRRNHERRLYYLGPPSYFHAVTFTIYGRMLSEHTNMDAVHAALRSEKRVWTCRHCGNDRLWQKSDVGDLWTAWNMRKWKEGD
jgi:hypothetical protein